MKTNVKRSPRSNGLRRSALEYHERYPKGKIEVIATKPCITQLDLSLAYTPGVAQPCLEIKKDPKKALQYTSKGNLVAVISNGTAVLGLGNIGPLAGKPVMEGKGVLFKRFANIDVFDIELDVDDPKEIIKTIKNISPTFGGINLEVGRHQTILWYCHLALRRRCHTSFVPTQTPRRTSPVLRLG